MEAKNNNPKTIFVTLPTVYSPFTNQRVDSKFVQQVYQKSRGGIFYDGDNILDLGIGSGYLRWVLHQAIKDKEVKVTYYGIDWNPLAVAAARINLEKIAGIPVNLKVHNNVIDGDGNIAFPGKKGESIRFRLIAANAPFFGVFAQDVLSWVEEGGVELVKRKLAATEALTGSDIPFEKLHDGDINGARFWVNLLEAPPKILIPERGEILAWNAMSVVDPLPKDPVVEIGRSLDLRVNTLFKKFFYGIRAYQITPSHVISKEFIQLKGYQSTLLERNPAGDEFQVSGAQLNAKQKSGFEQGQVSSPIAQVYDPEEGIWAIKRLINDFLDKAPEGEEVEIEVIVDGFKHRVGKSTFVKVMANNLNIPGFERSESMGEDSKTRVGSRGFIRISQVWKGIQSESKVYDAANKFQEEDSDTVLFMPIYLASSGKIEDIHSRIIERARVIINHSDSNRIPKEEMAEIWQSASSPVRMSLEEAIAYLSGDINPANVNLEKLRNAVQMLSVKGGEKENDLFEHGIQLLQKCDKDVKILIYEDTTNGHISTLINYPTRGIFPDKMIISRKRGQVAGTYDFQDDEGITVILVKKDGKQIRISIGAGNHIPVNLSKIRKDQDSRIIFSSLSAAVSFLPMGALQQRIEELKQIIDQIPEAHETEYIKRLFEDVILGRVTALLDEAEETGRKGRLITEEEAREVAKERRLISEAREIVKKMTDIYFVNEFDAKKKTVLFLPGADRGIKDTFSSMFTAFEANYNVAVFVFNHADRFEDIVALLNQKVKSLLKNKEMRNIHGVAAYSYGAKIFMTAYEQQRELYDTAQISLIAPALNGSQFAADILLNDREYEKRLQSQYHLKNVLRVGDPYSNDELHNRLTAFIQKIAGQKLSIMFIDGDKHARREEDGSSLENADWKRRDDAVEEAAGDSFHQLSVSSVDPDYEPHYAISQDHRAIDLIRKHLLSNGNAATSSPVRTPEAKEFQASVAPLNTKQGIGSREDSIKQSSSPVEGAKVVQVRALVNTVVVKVISKILGIDGGTIDPQASLKDLDADPAKINEIIAALEYKYEIKINVYKIWKLLTVEILTIIVAEGVITKHSGKKASSPIGGIDFNPAGLNLQIKRDGSGVPLPLNMQPIELIEIDGFLPVIINITPVSSLPLLSAVINEQPPRNSSQEEEYQPSPMAYLDERYLNMN